ncbi:MAG: DUF397 domain-containing protein [Sinomonas sp.]|nr:DUF397 domain-containing protein [Sinomonas sp.]
MRNDPTAVVPARGCSFVGGALRISALGRQKFAMRRSDKPRGGTLYFTSAELDAFLDGVRRGEFDLA